MYEMFQFLHGAPYAICVELKYLYLFVFCFGGILFVSCVTVCGCGWQNGDEEVKSWDGWYWVAYGCLCDGSRWGESARVSCIGSRVYGVSVGAGGEVEGVLGDWTYVGDLCGVWVGTNEGVGLMN